MHIAVMGAGAIGCYFGGVLARAGHKVTFIGRPIHVDAIARNGLQIETKDGIFTVPAEASTEPSAVAGADVVLVCVKSGDTEASGRAMAASLAPGAAILSLQNGVDNAERLAATIGRPVIPTVVYVGTGMAGPGHVKHYGRGELAIGASPQGAQVAKLFEGTAIQAFVSEKIAEALWGKLIINCAYNALSAVAQISYGPMMAMEGCRQVVANVVRECVMVSAACGVPMDGLTAEKIIALAATMPGQKSSTAQDLARGKPTEVDYLNGYIVRKGGEFGIPTPTNLALQMMVKLAELSRVHSPVAPA